MTSQGFYTVKAEKIEGDEILKEIIIERTKDSKLLEKETPEDQEELAHLINETLDILTATFRRDRKKKFPHYFEQLFQIAQDGLTGKVAMTKSAFREIDRFKADIVRMEGYKIKNYYLQELGIMAAGGIGLGLFGIGVFCLIPVIFPEMNNAIMVAGISYMLLWCGTMIGTWVSTGSRNLELAFEDIPALNSGKRESILRLIFVGICGLIFGILFHFDIFTIDLGILDTRSFESQPEIGFMLGILLGLGEKTIGLKITRKATALTEKIG